MKILQSRARIRLAGKRPNNGMPGTGRRCCRPFSLGCITGILHRESMQPAWDWLLPDAGAGGKPWRGCHAARRDQCSGLAAGTLRRLEWGSCAAAIEYITGHCHLQRSSGALVEVVSLSCHGRQTTEINRRDRMSEREDKMAHGKKDIHHIHGEDDGGAF